MESTFSAVLKQPKRKWKKTEEGEIYSITTISIDVKDVSPEVIERIGDNSILEIPMSCVIGENGKGMVISTQVR